MRVLLHFTQDDVYRLFLTYKRNPSNYNKIKERVIGEGARKQFGREMRGKWLFLGAITIIALVSSLYPMAAGDWRSAGALAVLWLAFVLAFGIWYAVSYRLSYRVLRRNELFFEDFEQIAQACSVLEEFDRRWQNEKA